MRPNDGVELLAHDLARAARRAGCQVRAQGRFFDGKRWWPVVELGAPNNDAAIRFLNEAFVLDAGNVEVRDLALRLKQAHPADFLAAVHLFVKTSVRFVREAKETFQHTLYTISRGAGDCDDHARAVAALATAAGEKARVVGVPGSDGRLGHVCAQLWDGSAWQWAETTVNARFGEPPREAARRLGVVRTDIWRPSRKEILQ